MRNLRPFLFKKPALAGLAQTLLLIGDWEFEWPSLRLAPPGRCISNPAVYFFGTGFKGRWLVPTVIHVSNSYRKPSFYPVP